MRIIIPSILTSVLIEADEQGITRVNFIKASTFPIERKVSKVHSGEEALNLGFKSASWSHITAALLWLDAYFEHRPLPPLPPLHLIGTPFQQSVWNVLLQIPYGCTTTYGAIARQISNPKAAQAVGQAVGANPIAVIVPCHRVLAAHGLGGYAYGLEVKSHLLAIEGSVLL